MDRRIPRRVWVAFLVVPVAAVFALAASAAVWLIARGEPVGPTLAGTVHASFTVAVLGLPVTYLVELALAMPLYLALREREGLGPWRVVMIAAVVGALVVPIVWPVFSEGLLEWEMVPIGGVVGAGVGCVLAGLAGMRSRSRPAS